MRRALILDCDGVLVDAEQTGHLRAFNEMWRRLDVPWQWTPEDYARKLAISGGRNVWPVCATTPPSGRPSTFPPATVRGRPSSGPGTRSKPTSTWGWSSAEIWTCVSVCVGSPGRPSSPAGHWRSLPRDRCVRSDRWSGTRSATNWRPRPSSWPETASRPRSRRRMSICRPRRSSGPIPPAAW